MVSPITNDVFLKDVQVAVEPYLQGKSLPENFDLTTGNYPVDITTYRNIYSTPLAQNIRKMADVFKGNIPEDSTAGIEIKKIADQVPELLRRELVEKGLEEAGLRSKDSQVKSSQGM